MQIFLPALPAIQDYFGISTGAAQMALTSSMISVALATLAYGPLSDRYGRRPMLLCGIFLLVTGSVICATAPSLEILILGRVVQASGGAAGMVLSRAVVRDIWPSDKTAQVLAQIMVAVIVAPMVAPTIGGLFIDYVGWRANFLFVAGVGAGIFLLMAIYFGESHQTTTANMGLAGMFHGFGRLLRMPAFRAYAFQIAFSMSVFFSFMSAAPYVMTRVLHRPATEYGLYFMVMSLGFMLGSWASPRLSRKIGPTRTIFLGSVGVLVFALVAVVLALYGPWSPLSLFAPTVVAAIFNGMSVPNSQAGAVSVDPDIAGAASGLAGFIQMTMVAVTAQISGHFQDDTPIPMVVFMAIWALMSLGVFAIEIRRARSVAG